MKIVTRYALLFLLVPPHACQTPKPIAMSTVAVPSNPNIHDGDVLVEHRKAGQDIPPLRGQDVVTVRTFANAISTSGETSKLVELEGVSCKLSSDGYTASVVTPAQVNVPDYGYASRPIMARCDAKGYRPGVLTVSAFNLTEQENYSVATNGGLLGVMFAAIVHAASDVKKHDFAYPGLKVIMNPVGCERTKAGCR